MALEAELDPMGVMNTRPERTRDALFFVYFGQSDLFADEIERMTDHHMKTANPIDLGAIIPLLSELDSTTLLENINFLDTAQVFAFFSHFILPWAQKISSGFPTREIKIPPDAVINNQTLLGLLLTRSASFSLEQEHAIVDRVFDESTSVDLNQTREFAHALLETWKTSRLLSMIRAMIDAGVSTGRARPTGLTAGQIAEKTNQQVVASFIDEYSAETPSSLHTTFDSFMDRTRYLCQTFARKVSSNDLARLMQVALEEASLMLFWTLTTIPRAAAAASAASNPHEFLKDDRFNVIPYDFNQPNVVTREYPMMTLMYHPDGTPRPDPTGARLLLLQMFLMRGTDRAIATNPTTGRPENLLMRVISDSNILAMVYLTPVKEMANFVDGTFDSPIKRIVDWHAHKWHSFLFVLYPALGRLDNFLAESGSFPSAIVRTLLKVGVDPNIAHVRSDEPGSPPVPILFECVLDCFQIAVKHLLDSGADPNARAGSSTAIEVALAQQRAAKAAHRAIGSFESEDKYDAWSQIVTNLLKFGAIVPPGEEETLGFFLMRMWNSVQNSVRNFELPEWTP